jgi:23S rRNA (cytidine1920-2'-O)/16S rRNA (cytidine1409-2'-O)-methyltransferase
MTRQRADTLMVERGLADTRERAQRLIMAGQARVGTTRLVKPATMLAPDAPIELVARERFVSRGGLKLQAALDDFGITLAGRDCMDVGASTGGFTDCMLQAGASSVVAVDVGRGQLHQRLRDDVRVTLRDHTNARDLPDLGREIAFFAIDVSFISVVLVLPAVALRVPPGTEGIVLLKPQFEAGRGAIGKGGVVRDFAVRAGVLARFEAWLAGHGWAKLAVMDCPVAGGDGNIEFLVHVRTPAAPC